MLKSSAAVDINSNKKNKRNQNSQHSFQLKAKCHFKIVVWKKQGFSFTGKADWILEQKKKFKKANKV